MPRPPKWRRVEFLPEITYFKPSGVPLRQLDEVVLTVEELEAIRLKDMEGLEQEDCAEKMGVSRSTFFRIINSARSKVADALINAKAIRIEGGNYKYLESLECKTCGYVWQEENPGEPGGDTKCPKCNGRKFAPAGHRRGWCHGRGGDHSDF